VQKPIKRKTKPKKLANDKMANIIYDYPKSSCRCYNCTDKTYSYESTGIPSNMSIVNCEIPAMYDCYNNLSLGSDIQPQDNHGYTMLNPKVFDHQYSNDFQSINCSRGQGCPKVQYASKDPRLISASHSGQVLTLDRPPITNTIKLKDVAQDKTLDKYGQGYSTYSNINAGQIVYYINKAQEDAFFLPNFTIPARVYKNLHKDPMGAILTEYNRVPLKSTNPLNTEKNTYEGGLSWIQDSVEHREDLMSRQMGPQLEQRWGSRWKLPK
jgi:hypothetical protein